MSDKYPSMSPYNYCANNPVILVDPDGNYFVKGEEIVDLIKTRTNEMITNLLINSLILKSKKENSNLVTCKIESDYSDNNIGAGFYNSNSQLKFQINIYKLIELIDKRDSNQGN